MNFIYDDSYLDDESEDTAWRLQKVYAFKEIEDFSRQIRSLLKYKEQIVKFRFRNSFIIPVHRDLTQLLKDKESLQGVALKFINILREIKKNAGSIEHGIKNHTINPNSSILRQLIEVLTKLFILIHKFSEQELYNHPHLLKLVISLAREAYLVKKFLDLDIEEFLLELELSYEGLEDEIEKMLSLRDHIKHAHVQKQLEKGLRS